MYFTLNSVFRKKFIYFNEVVYGYMKEEKCNSEILEIYHISTFVLF